MIISEHSGLLQLCLQPHVLNRLHKCLFSGTDTPVPLKPITVHEEARKKLQGYLKPGLYKSKWLGAGRRDWPSPSSNDLQVIICWQIFMLLVEPDG